MNAPTPQDIAAMKRLRMIMEGQDPGPAPQATPPAYRASHMQPHAPQAPIHVSPPGATPADTMAMKKILDSFYGAAGETMQTLHEEAQTSPYIQEAMQTVATPTGAIIGRYEVRVRLQESATGKQRKIYDVVNPQTREVVAEKLVIYEAAHAVVRFLNKGLPLNSGKVQEVLELEETFHRNRSEAARFKQRFDRCVQLGEREAADVFESRYQTARANALVAHDQIKSILESIR